MSDFEDILDGIVGADGYDNNDEPEIEIQSICETSSSNHEDDKE